MSQHDRLAAAGLLLVAIATVALPANESTGPRVTELALRCRAGTAWSAGRVQLWEPLLACGFPLAGEPRAAVWYPGNLLLAGDQPAAGSAWFVFLHLLMMAAAGYGWLRRLGASPAGSAAGVLVLLLTLSAGGLLLTPAGWAGVAWLTVAVALAEAGRWPLAGLTAGAAALAGDPACAVLAVVWLLGRGCRLGRWPTAVASGGLAVALAAPVWLAAWQLAGWRQPPVWPTGLAGGLPALLALAPAPLVLLLVVTAAVSDQVHTRHWAIAGGMALLTACWLPLAWLPAALLTAAAVALMMSDGEPARRAAWPWLGAALLAAVGLLVLPRAAGAWSGWVGAAALLVAGAATLVQPRRRAVPALLTLLAVTVLVAGPRRLVGPPPLAQGVGVAAAQAAGGRVWLEDEAPPDLGWGAHLFGGVPAVTAPVGLSLGRTDRVVAKAGELLGSEAAQPRYGYSPLAGSLLLMLRIGLLPGHLAGQSGGELAPTQALVLPPLHLARQWRGVGDERSSLAAVEHESSYGSLAVVEAAGHGFGLGEVTEARWRGPNWLAGQVEANGSPWLVAADAAYPGWELWLADRRVDWLPTNHLYRGAVLPPGRYVANWVWRPVTVRLGLFAALLATAVAATWLTAGRQGE